MTSERRLLTYRWLLPLTLLEKYKESDRVGHKNVAYKMVKRPEDRGKATKSVTDGRK